MKNIIEKIKKSVLIKRTTTIIFMLVIVALFIALTLWVNSLNLEPIDFTSEKLYTLTQTSKERVKNVQKEVNMYFIGYSEGDPIIDLAKQYHNENSKINIEVTNSTSRPDLVEKYAIEGNSNGIIVEGNEKSKILSTSDFYTYDPSTYEQIDITEEKLTNSILYVVAEKIPTVYFLEGYSEFSISENMNYLSMYLANEITEYKTLNILTTGNIPEDCDILAIMSPTEDFMEVEVQAIKNYINKGGNIYFSLDVVSETTALPNLQLLLDEYGVSVQNGYILEYGENQSMSSYPYIFMPQLSSTNKITEDIYSDSFMWLVYSARLKFKDEETLQNLNVTKETLLSSTDDSIFVTDF